MSEQEAEAKEMSRETTTPAARLEQLRVQLEEFRTRGAAIGW